MKRLIAIFIVWAGCAAAWLVLGGSVGARTGGRESVIRDEVWKLWGPPLDQPAPRAVISPDQAPATPPPVPLVDGEAAPASTSVVHLTGSDLRVDLSLDHRKRGLFWFPTFGVAFVGTYAFEHEGEVARRVDFELPLDAWQRVFDAVSVVDEAGDPVAMEVHEKGVRWHAVMAPGEHRNFGVSYAARGVGQWRYGTDGGLAGDGGHVRNFRLEVETNFDRVDFPLDGLSPTRHGATASGGWRGVWDSTSLIYAGAVGILPPQRLNPGPLVQRITLFGPVGLMFFFFVVSMLAARGQVDLHPMHYLLIGCGFFAFHLLFAYLVDHLDVHLSFALASVTSVGLVVTYARLFTGWRFALGVMGLAQAFFLVLFSYTFFWEGKTGLAITVGAIATLFLVMQVTGGIEWRGLGKYRSVTPLDEDDLRQHGTAVPTRLDQTDG